MSLVENIGVKIAYTLKKIIVFILACLLPIKQIFINLKYNNFITMILKKKSVRLIYL